MWFFWHWAPSAGNFLSLGLVISYLDVLYYEKELNYVKVKYYHQSKYTEKPYLRDIMVTFSFFIATFIEFSYMPGTGLIFTNITLLISKIILWGFYDLPHFTKKEIELREVV